MRTCPECGERVATAGVLEIHEQVAHGARDAGGQTMARSLAPHELDLVPLRPAPRAAGALPLALLIVVLLVAGVVAAVGHSPEKATPLGMVRAASSRTLETHTARLYVSLKSASGPLANGITEELLTGDETCTVQ